MGKLLKNYLSAGTGPHKSPFAAQIGCVTSGERKDCKVTKSDQSVAMKIRNLPLVSPRENLQILKFGMRGYPTHRRKYLAVRRDRVDHPF
jgi:hypothetical protein